MLATASAVSLPRPLAIAVRSAVSVCLQIHHALCEMLADILTPLVRKNQPHSCTGLSPGLLADWYNVILRLKNDIGQWANKHNKHIMVSQGLFSAFLCLLCNDIIAASAAAEQAHVLSQRLSPSCICLQESSRLAICCHCYLAVNTKLKRRMLSAMQVGYPLVTVLVCLVDNQNYNSLVDSMADFLAKQMKNKEYRYLSRVT